MKIILKKLILKKFKGISDLTVNFDGNKDIYGRNGTGKTTIFDAYMWLLFNKDSNNSSDFDIKTIEKDGSVPNVEHTVEGILEVDGKEITLSKTYKEIWTKKRGSVTETFTRNTTDYSINQVPVKEKEYKDRVASIIDEETFKLISNPRYFSEMLDKNKRREILMQITDDISDEDIFKKNKALKELPLEDYTIQEILSMKKATLKKTNDKLKELPVRIDELLNSIVEENFDSLEFKRRSVTPAIDEIDKQLSVGDNTEALKDINNKISEKLKEQLKIKEEIDNKNREHKAKYEEEVRNKNNSLKACEEKIRDTTYSMQRKKELIEERKETVEKLRNEWIEVSSKKADVDHIEHICPTCGQELPAGMVEEAISKFNLNKSNELERITLKANKAKEDVKEIEEELDQLNKQLEVCMTEKENILKIEIEEPLEELYPKTVIKLEEEIKELRNELNNFKTEDNTALIEKKRGLQEELKDIDEKLAYKAVNESNKAKIESYKEEQKELAKIYTETEKIIFLAEEYQKLRAELISKDINNKFDFVGFKLFDTQVNGGIQEVCEATVNNVPYASVNNAGKINAGLDIINTLSKHYDTYAPIFIDNAESVNEVMQVDGQLIKLIVSEDKELKL